MVKSNKKKSFLKKLLAILNDEANNKKYIFWDKQGKIIIIPDEKKFSKKVIPKYFSHKNYSSFVRQLNIYNFKGKRHKDGSLRYMNENFLKNMTEEDIDNMETKEFKNKNITNKEKNEDKQEIITEELINNKNIKGILEKCLSDIKQNLDFQKKLFEQIDYFKKEKSREKDKNKKKIFQSVNYSMRKCNKEIKEDCNEKHIYKEKNEINNSRFVCDNPDDLNDNLNQTMIQVGDTNFVPNLRKSIVNFQ